MILVMTFTELMWLLKESLGSLDFIELGGRIQYTNGSNSIEGKGRTRKVGDELERVELNMGRNLLLPFISFVSSGGQVSGSCIAFSVLCWTALLA